MLSSPPDRTGRLLVSMFAGALFLASPLAAQVPPPEERHDGSIIDPNCSHRPLLFGGDVVCTVRNPFDRAIADLRYTITYAEDGREVPWAQGESKTSIDGGIEPGEEVALLSLNALGMPVRAEDRTIQFIFTNVEAYAIDGSRLNPDPVAPVATTFVPAKDPDPLTDGEQQAIRNSVQGFWNVGVLSTEALRGTVIVTFAVDPDGVPDVASIRTAADLSNPAIRQAYEAARRAIIRSAVEGLPLPPEKYEQWKELTLRFNMDEMRIE